MQARNTGGPGGRGLPRRTLLLTALAGVMTAGATLPSAAPAAAATTTSANGWPLTTTGIATLPVPGTAARVSLLEGDVSTVLVHVIRRFHYEVQEVARHELAGHRPAAGLTGHTTNYASGTAVEIRPAAYPQAAAGVLFPPQLAVVRDILKECGAVVAWGGDLRRPHAAHFQIAVRPGDPRLRGLARRITGWTQAPGQGAGVFTLGA
ncbi:hypothetical protein [Streptomyces galbus]|uniref:M15 family metallopeptidase n=1 Tax=Streptomyces galbus TaxID=33898 RepID=A0A4U5WSR1_STRGB|nr:hypothetical protein [Streptomyces galbus]TKT05418.1 hypothetical protein E4U92_30375 [Streptomyces galbus]GHD53169.1 hypothetical protein GCM10010335_66380 [Streptomyces galbus]